MLNDAESLIRKVDNYLENGFNSQKEKFELASELVKSKSEIEKISVKDELNSVRKFDIFKQLDILSNNVKGATNFKILNLSQRLSVEQKKMLEKIFETISEHCDKKEADKLINEIMKKF